MGTNYYWRDRPCVCCKRYDEIHVGKSSGTWRAYKNKLVSEENPDWGYETKSPFDFPVLSLSDWRRVFTERPGELWTEYNEQIPDPLKWLSEMKPWLDSGRGSSLEWRRGWLQKDVEMGVGWLDSEGFKFYDSEFS